MSVPKFFSARHERPGVLHLPGNALALPVGDVVHVYVLEGARYTLVKSIKVPSSGTCSLTMEVTWRPSATLSEVPLCITTWMAEGRIQMGISANGSGFGLCAHHVDAPSECHKCRASLLCKTPYDVATHIAGGCTRRMAKYSANYGAVCDKCAE